MSILRKPEVKRELGWRSDSSVTQAVNLGLLTKPVEVSERAKGWPHYEIQAIAASRIAGRSHDDIRALVIRLHAQRLELATG
jgi:prophage regulatory protein